MHEINKHLINYETDARKKLMKTEKKMAHVIIGIAQPETRLCLPARQRAGCTL